MVGRVLVDKLPLHEVVHDSDHCAQLDRVDSSAGADSGTLPMEVIYSTKARICKYCSRETYTGFFKYKEAVPSPQAKTRRY